MISNREKKYKLRRYNIIQIKNKQEKENQNKEELICYKNELFHNEKECFVCLEIYIDNSKTIRLNNMNDYIKNCSCDSWIHEHCFNKWHNVNKNCPICRSVIIFTKYEYCILIIHDFKKNTCKTLILVCKLIKQIFIYTLCFWCLYKFCNSFF